MTSHGPKVGEPIATECRGTLMALAYSWHLCGIEMDSVIEGQSGWMWHLDFRRVLHFLLMRLQESVREDHLVKTATGSHEVE